MKIRISVHDCIVSEWGPWSPCPIPDPLPNCNDEVKRQEDPIISGEMSERHRVVLHNAINGGQECPILVQKKPCSRFLHCKDHDGKIFKKNYSFRKPDGKLFPLSVTDFGRAFASSSEKEGKLSSSRIIVQSQRRRSEEEMDSSRSRWGSKDDRKEN